MKKKLLILFFSMSTFCPVFSQIQGRVTDANNQPVEFANVALYALPDSMLVTGTITNKNGEFSLNANDIGNAFLRISFIGYETQVVPAISGQTIVLKAENTILGEVVVKGNLPKIQLKNDALVATVQNSVLSKAGTANDVLKRLPLLTGDDGVFSVFGKGEAKIYINNREMRDASELDNLNSADIKDVEIVNNPGARYDATVKAVIRINTTRKAGDGFGFDVRSSYWQSQNTDLTEQLNLNYRKNGLDIFGTFSYNRNASIQDSKLFQTTYVDTLWTQENNMYSDRLSHTLTGIAGLNYEISPKHYIGMKYTHTAYPSNNSLTELNSMVLADGVFYDKWKSVEEMRTSNKPAHRFNGYYSGSIGNFKLDFNTDFYKGTAVSQSFVTENSQEYDDRKVNSGNRVNNRLMAAKLVFSYPVLGGQLSVGSELTDTDRKDEYTNNQSIVPSSNTIIQEQNNSFFAEYSRSIPIGQFSAGLRYENVRSDYFDNDLKIDEQSKRYDQWFPTISFSTQLKNVQLQLSYTAKTNRPTYRQLSSNVFYVNRFSLQTGNPYLTPSTVHDVTLIGTWKFMQLVATYKKEKNAVIYWAEQLEENPAVTLLAYRNLEKLPTLATFLTASPTFGLWSPQASVGFVKQWLTITANDVLLVLNKPMPITSLNNSFSLSGNFLFTLDMSFQGKGNYQNAYLSNNQFVVNVGITKSFLNDQLQVALKGHDVFRGRKDGTLLHNHQMDLLQFNQYDSREVELTVRYKFNSVKSKYKGTGAGENELKRLK